MSLYGPDNVTNEGDEKPTEQDKDVSVRAGSGLRHRLHQKGSMNEDLFMSLALDEPDGDNEPNSHPMQTRPASRYSGAERLQSSAFVSSAAPRGSLPAMADLHISTTQLNDNLDTAYYEQQRHANGEETPTASRYPVVGRQHTSSPPASLRDGPTSRVTNRSPTLSHAGSRYASGAMSETTARQPRLYRVSGLDALNEVRTIPNSAEYGSGTLFSGPRKSDPETDSVDSFGAPSTVWDELDDLKSRIKKLEYTGKLPTTSGAPWTSSIERPRTATTAPTTISSSPHHTRNTSSSVTVSGAANTDIHPLLHSALAKSKAMLSSSLYRALEASAADALNLAAITSNSGPQGTTYSAASIINGVAVSDRQLRRKVDSLCRNITDLCIALCETKSDLASPVSKVPSGRPPGQEDTPPSRYSRRTSIGLEDKPFRSSPSRNLNLHEHSRRSSLLGLGVSNTPVNSPRAPSDQYPQQSPSPNQNQNQIDYAARYNRSGSSLLRARQSRLDQESPEEPIQRVPSRAMTDVGQSRPSQNRRIELSSSIQPRSPSLREALAARRASAGIPEDEREQQISSPMPSIQDETQKFLVRHTVPASEAGSITSERPRRRITSLEQYAASSRMSNDRARNSSLTKSRDIVVD